MWVEGGKYGSVDPCYPAKVAQAHVHNLLFHQHSEQKPLDYIFFPCITDIGSPLKHVMAHASCPIVSGAPLVIQAAVTKASDFFAPRGIGCLAPARPWGGARRRPALRRSASRAPTTPTPGSTTACSRSFRRSVTRSCRSDRSRRTSSGWGGSFPGTPRARRAERRAAPR